MVVVEGQEADGGTKYVTGMESVLVIMGWTRSPLRVRRGRWRNVKFQVLQVEHGQWTDGYRISSNGGGKLLVGLS